MAAHHDSLIQLLTKAHQQAFCTAVYQNSLAACHTDNYRWYHVFELTPIAENPQLVLPQQSPKVLICMGLMSDDFIYKNRLEISYFIEKTPLLDLHIANSRHHRADFLWQEHCLECFVEYDGATAYFESNVALDGRYNTYHFDAYRTPNALPPRQAKLSDMLISNAINHCDVVDNFYSRHISLTGNKGAAPTCINPCVILYPDGTPIYYAPRHANPPDFHDKNYWHTLNLNA